jgi:hypothetical protein
MLCRNLNDHRLPQVISQERCLICRLLPVRPAIRSFFSHTWLNVLKLLGTTTLAVALSLIVPFVTFVLQMGYDLHHRRHGDAVLPIIATALLSWSTAVSVGVTAFAWTYLWVRGAAQTITQDYELLKMAQNSPPQRETPNLKLHALAGPRLGVRDGIWTRGIFQYDQLAKTIQISNQALPGRAVGAAHVRAQMIFRNEDKSFLISPLTWLEHSSTDFEIPPGQIGELIIATKSAFELWDFVPHGNHGESWAPGYDFDLELNLIDVEEGTILLILYFRWHWREEPLLPQLFLVPKPTEHVDQGGSS